MADRYASHLRAFLDNPPTPTEHTMPAKPTTKATPQVFCSDCVHQRSTKSKRPGVAYEFHYCNGVRDRVTGQHIQTQCITASSKNGPCGPSGKLYEARVLEAAE